MWRLIRERIGRRRLLLSGAAAGVGALAGSARAAGAEGLSWAPGASGSSAAPGALAGSVSAGTLADGSALGTAAARPTGEQTWSPPFDYRPIIRRPRIEWPNGARVAFWVGLNIEYFEWDRPAIGNSSTTMGLVPDPLNVGWRDYGPRVGIWRQMEVLDKYGLRASVLLNSDVCHHYPEIIEEGNKRNWTWLAHGKTNSAQWTNMPLEEERRAMAEVIGTIRDRTGKQPRGWLGPALTETPNTPEVLAENGVSYICDYCNDDQPYPMKVRAGRMISVPYSLEINDIGLFIGKTTSGPAFYDIVADQFDVLYEDGATRPRVMALALHPMIIGQPYRHKYLDKVLGYITGHSDVWLTTSDEIADWYYQRYYAQEAAQMGLTRAS
jgi:allantoinase